MFTEQKIITILNVGKTKPSTQKIIEALRAEIKRGWHIVTAIAAPDGLVVVVERAKAPVDRARLPVY